MGASLACIMIDCTLHPPHAALRPFIGSYFCLSSAHRRDSQTLPAGRACLWIVRRGTAKLTCGPEPHKAIWPVTLTGPFHRHHALDMNDHAHIFGAWLTPTGWGGLIKRAANRCADQASDAAFDLGASVAQLPGEMANCACFSEMAQVADTFFAQHLAPIPAR